MIVDINDSLRSTIFHSHYYRFYIHRQRSGRIQGGLARITRAIFATADDNARAGMEIPIGYDIEYVLGGKLSNLARCDLAYTTATAEGLVDATDNSRGHLLRRRRPAAVEKEREVADSSKDKDRVLGLVAMKWKPPRNANQEDHLRKRLMCLQKNQRMW